MSGRALSLLPWWNAYKYTSPSSMEITSIIPGKSYWRNRTWGHKLCFREIKLITYRWFPNSKHSKYDSLAPSNMQNIIKKFPRNLGIFYYKHILPKFKLSVLSDPLLLLQNFNPVLFYLIILCTLLWVVDFQLDTDKYTLNKYMNIYGFYSYIYMYIYVLFLYINVIIKGTYPDNNIW